MRLGAVDWPDPKVWWTTTWDAFGKIAADIGMKPGTLLLVSALLVGAAFFVIRFARARKGS